MFSSLKLLNSVIILQCVLVRTDHLSEFIGHGLDEMFETYKNTWISDENRDTFEKAMANVEDVDHVFSERVKRDMPTMYMGKKKKMRTCANMNGILGGSNAFNYISFVMAVLTLVVNVNNNINNNNNNLNQANINTASNNNANANSNNNNANVVNVMPPGKKRRKRKVPYPFDVHEDKICVASQQSSVSNEASLAAVLLVQGIFKSLQKSNSDTCSQAVVCKALSDARGLGLGGRMLTMAISTLLGVFGQEREMVRSFDMLEHCGEEDIDDTDCDTNKKHEHIQCGRCGHTLADPKDIVNIETPHAMSVARMDLFGQPNVTVNELVNPSDFHFRSFNVANSSCVASDNWQGGDTWYEGYSWRVCYCPVCGQAVGWQWEKDQVLEEQQAETHGEHDEHGGHVGHDGHVPDAPDHYSWVGLRLGKVSDWSNYFIGPLSDMPNVVRQLLNSLGK